MDNNDENHKTIFKLGRKSYSTKVSPSFDQSIISQNLSREPIAFCMVRGIYAHIHSLFFNEEKKMDWEWTGSEVGIVWLYTTNKYNPHWNNFYLSQIEPHCSLTINCIELYGFHQFCSSLEGSEKHIKHICCLKVSNQDGTKSFEDGSKKFCSSQKHIEQTIWGHI